MLSCRVSILDAFFSTNIYATARYFLGVGGTGRFPEHVFVQCALAVLYVGRYHGRRGCTVYVRGAEEGVRFFVFFPCGVAVFGGDDSIKIRAFLKHSCVFLGDSQPVFLLRIFGFGAAYYRLVWYWLVRMAYIC